MGAEMRRLGWARLVLIHPDGTREPEGQVFVRAYHPAGDPRGNPEVAVVRYWTHEGGNAVERRAALEMPRVGMWREVEPIGGAA